MEFPVLFDLSDGTHVKIYKAEEDCYEFYLTRLNSEQHNFLLNRGRIEESYETRFDHLQNEAVERFQTLLRNSATA